MIGVPVFPTVLVSGTVSLSQPRFSRQTGALYATDVTIDADPGGCGLRIRYWAREDKPVTPPDVGQPAAVWAQVSEDRQYGASLSWERDAVPSDLDRIAGYVPGGSAVL